MNYAQGENAVGLGRPTLHISGDVLLGRDINAYMMYRSNGFFAVRDRSCVDNDPYQGNA